MKKTNKKGFTLIELLAVIVVLALIMILAVPSILTSMNNAKKKTFQMYGQRLLDSALSEYESQKMLNTITTKRYNSEPCYLIEDLGFKSQGNNKGMVVVHASDLLGATSYTLYLTDKTFAYNGTESGDVANKPAVISGEQKAIDEVLAAINQCS